MKKHAIRVALILIAIGAVVAVALFLKDTRDRLDQSRYDASAPTSEKFAKLSRWIPETSEFDVTVDVPKALANLQLKDKLERIVGSRAGVAAELVKALIQSKGAVGLLTITGTAGTSNSPPKVVIIAQGKFDKDVMLPAIRKVMTEGRAGLSSRDVGWSTMYYESDSKKPFGFMLLDGQHMAVGDKVALEAFFIEEPAKSKPLVRPSDDVIFGHVEIGERLRRMAPRMLSVPSSVDFSSEEGAILNASADCGNQIKAMSTRMFIEGIRSLIILQHENNAPLVGILEGISIESEGSEIKLSTKLALLLDLWAGRSDEEKIEVPAHPVDKPPVEKLDTQVQNAESQATTE